MNRSIFIIPAAMLLRIAAAEPPWDVDDPGVTAVGTATYYFSYRQTEERGAREEALGLFAFTYGLTPRVEIGLGLDALFASTTDLGRSNHWRDLWLSAKWLVSGTPDEPNLAVAYQTTLPSGAQWAGAGAVTHSIWVSHQTRGSRLRLTSDAGVILATRRDSSSLFYGAVVDFAIDSKTRVGFQLAAKGLDFTANPLDFQGAFGVIRQATDRLSFQLLVGRSLSNGSKRHVFAGFTYDMVSGGTSP